MKRKMEEAMKKIKQLAYKINLLYPNAAVIASVLGGFALCYLVGYLFCNIIAHGPCADYMGPGWDSEIVFLGVGIWLTFILLVIYFFINGLKRQIIRLYKAWRNPLPMILPRGTEDFTVVDINTLADCLDFICDNLIYTTNKECYPLLKKWLVDICINITEDKLEIDGDFESSPWYNFVRLQIEKFDGMAIVLRRTLEIAIVCRYAYKGQPEYALLATKELKTLCGSKSKTERENLIFTAVKEQERIRESLL